MAYPDLDIYTEVQMWNNVHAKVTYLQYRFWQWCLHIKNAVCPYLVRGKS